MIDQKSYFEVCANMKDEVHRAVPIMIQTNDILREGLTMLSDDI